MQQHLVAARWPWCMIEHVRLDYSEKILEIGTFSFRKIGRLARVIWRVWLARLRGRIDVLYYPPGGAHRIPFYRDLLTLFLLRYTARRLVLHIHAGGFDRLPGILTGVERALGRWLFGRADVAIVPSSLLSQEVAWVRPRAIAVVANGVPDLPLPPAGPALPGNLILFVGTLSEEKGILDLLTAVHHLVMTGCTATLSLVGDFRTGGLRRQVLDFLDTSHLESLVSLPGVLEGERLMAEYARARLFCLPTRDTEAMPLVLLEAMRSGLPVISTHWRTIPEIVGEAGILVPPGDPEALAAALRTLLHSEEQCAALGRAGRRRYEMQFTLAHHLETMERVLKTVAGE